MIFRSVPKMLGILLAAAACQPEADAKAPVVTPDQYVFPTDLLGPTGDSGSQFRNQWYSGVFIALREKALIDHRRDGSRFRLTVIPSFYNAFTFRMARRNGRDALVFKATSGPGGYDPGGLLTERTIPLSSSQAARLAQMFEQARVCDPRRDDRVGVDGSQWILESTDGPYCFADYWSPRKLWPDLAALLNALAATLDPLPPYVAIEMDE
ncbi:MAG: hypothetical protein GY952_01570 [Rhodobacteraceae bacterium]|nr:hypothetical protein [Paracoccaceae bacterium]